MSDFYQPHIDLEHRKDEVAKIVDLIPVCGYSGPQNDGADREPQYARRDVIETLAKYGLGFLRRP